MSVEVDVEAKRRLESPRRSMDGEVKEKSGGDK